MYTRRNLYLPDKMWEAIKREAAKETAQKGERLTPTEWVRDAIRRKLRWKP